MSMKTNISNTFKSKKKTSKKYQILGHKLWAIYFWTKSVIITWEPVRKAESQISRQTCHIQIHILTKLPGN